MSVPERIILGSGYIHITVYEKGKAIPNPEDFCKEENKYAYISGGAEISYKPSFYEAKDDMGKVAKSIITEEEATMKTGIMTFTGNTLDTLCDTARVTTRDNVVDGKTYREVKVGGAGNAKGAKYIICFHHIDAVDGDIYLMIVGQNQAGFTLSFKKSEATVVDAEFHALPIDGEGTLISYAEEIPSAEVAYTVTQTLAHVTSSFTAKTIKKGTNFEATLATESNYTLGTPIVLMSGEAVANAWNAGAKKITINNVSGDISITAAATKNG